MVEQTILDPVERSRCDICRTADLFRHDSRLSPLTAGPYGGGGEPFPVPLNGNGSVPADHLASLMAGLTSGPERTAALARVLVVDDDERYCAALSPILHDARFEVSVVTTGASALTALGDQGAEMVLLDLVLPDVSGTELCQQLRQRFDVPIIIVTARANEFDRVVALEVGADDYVIKPYSPPELVARMRAVLRRWRRPAAEEPAPPLLAAGPVRVDVDRHIVMIHDRTVRLPLKEFELLELLLRNAGRVLTRRQIIERVWGADYVGDTKTLDTHVRRLRRRLEPVPSEPRHLVTVRGMGFRFQP